MGAHTGDELARAAEEYAYNPNSPSQSNHHCSWVDPEEAFKAGARWATQADNVLQEVRSAVFEVLRRHDVSEECFAEVAMITHAALKASPTTEPNPNEGMQVAEREGDLAFLRAIGEVARVNGPISVSRETGASIVEVIDRLSTLTSASNP